MLDSQSIEQSHTMNQNQLRGEYLRLLDLQPYRWVLGAQAEVAAAFVGGLDTDSNDAPDSGSPAETRFEPAAQEQADAAVAMGQVPAAVGAGVANVAPEAAVVDRLPPPATPGSLAAELSAPEQPAPASAQSAPELPLAAAEQPAPELRPEFQPPAWAAGNLSQFDRNLPRFSLCFVQFDQRLLVVYDGSRHAHVVDSGDQSLVRRMATAMLQSESQQRVNVFTWPQLPATSRVDLSIKVARSATTAYLQQRLRKSPVAKILLLGRVPACYLLPVAELALDYGELRGRVLSLSGVDAVLSEEIGVLQEHPGSKRGAWQDMQGLMAGSAPGS